MKSLHGSKKAGVPGIYLAIDPQPKLFAIRENGSGKLRRSRRSKTEVSVIVDSRGRIKELHP